MPTFDVVSKIEHHELDNAIDQAKREIATRFDFKDAAATIEKSDEGIILRANSAGRVEAVLEVLRSKVIKRQLSVKVLDPQPAQPAGGMMWRQTIKLREGVAIEKAKEIVKLLKDSKLKVQAAIQGDVVRVTGKKRDDLQEAIALLRSKDLDLPLQYINFRD